MSAKRFLLLLLLLSAFATPAVLAQKQFGFDNRKPSGQPYLSPEESVKRLQVPPGWEVKVFAAEPDIINPIAFTIDKRGRHGMRLVELAPGVSLDEVKARTEAGYEVDPKLN